MKTLPLRDDFSVLFCALHDPESPFDRDLFRHCPCLKFRVPLDEGTALGSEPVPSGKWRDFFHRDNEDETEEWDEESETPAEEFFIPDPLEVGEIR